MKILLIGRRMEMSHLDLRDCDPDELVMIVDLDRCISCGSCAIACELEHAEPDGSPGPFRPIRTAGEGRLPSRAVCLPTACRHCTSPCEYYSQQNTWITCPSGRDMDRSVPSCDFCRRRLDLGMWPACASRCSMKTIYFGPARDIAFTLQGKRLRELGDVRIG